MLLGCCWGVIARSQCGLILFVEAMTYCILLFKVILNRSSTCIKMLLSSFNYEPRVNGSAVFLALAASLVLLNSALVDCRMVAGSRPTSTPSSSSYTKIETTNYPCNCTCEMGSSNTQCMQLSFLNIQFKISGSTKKEIGRTSSTCWNALMTVPNTQIVNGLISSRDNACSAWIQLDFDKSEPIYYVNGVAYFKNFASRSFDLPQKPTLPPVYAFLISLERNCSHYAHRMLLRLNV